jgi:hypothetical protein
MHACIQQLQGCRELGQWIELYYKCQHETKKSIQ